MTCKDCIHLPVCQLMPSSCEHFKNKADFVEVKHGELVFSRREWGSSDYYQDTYYRCSNCRKEYEQFEIDEAYYCPNCGAKIDGGNAE